MRTIRFSFARLAPGLLLHAQVLDDVLGRLRDDVPLLVEAFSSGAPRDLLEVAHAEDRGLFAVVLAQAREEHGADRDVHPDSERIGAAHDREQPLLRELLDEQPVFREQPSVVKADAMREEAFHFLAVGRIEAQSRLVDGRADRALSILRQQIDAHQVLRGLCGAALREVDDVDRGAPRPQKLLNRLLQGRLPVLERERDRALAGSNGDRWTSRELRDRFLEGLGGPEGRAHEQELSALEDEERDLPRDAALLVGIVVKLVDDHAVDRCGLALPEGDVRQDLRGAAHDLRVAIDRGVARHEAHPVRAEVTAQREEFLAHERLDGSRVVAAPALAHGEEVKGQRDERLPTSGRCGQDDVVAREELEDRLLLSRVELEAQLGNVSEKQVEELFGGRPGSRRHSIGKRHRPLQ